MSVVAQKPNLSGTVLADPNKPLVGGLDNNNLWGKARSIAEWVCSREST